MSETLSEQVILHVFTWSYAIAATLADEDIYMTI